MCNQHKVLTKHFVSNFLPKRDNSAEKYDFGHTLIIAGAKSYPGAPLLATLGALSTGCGMVSLCVPESIYPVVCSRAPTEVIIFSLPETKNGTIAVKAVEVVIDYILKRRVTTICIGCGLGIDEETKIFVTNLFKLIYSQHSELKKRNIFSVIDADGINSLKIDLTKISVLKEQEWLVVLTPHLREYSRLVNKSFSDISSPELCSEILSFSKQNKVVTVLKGPITRISDGEHIFINNLPNSALAKAGSGDVLSGMIAGFVYQIEKYSPQLIGHKYLTPFRAATLSVFLHSQAGEIGSKEKTSFCFTASDIIKYLPRVIKDL